MLFYKQSNTASLFNYFLVATLLIQISGTPIHSADKQIENSHFELNVPFMSQKDQNYLPNTSCGPACVMMMLLYHVQQNKLPLTALSDYKKLCINLKTTATDGIYIKNIYSYFAQNNWDYCNSFKDYNELRDALKSGPVTVFIELKSAPGFLGFLLKILKPIEDKLSDDKIGHAVVLIGANKQGFIYLDPLYHKHSGKYKKFISYKKFSTQWTGKACQLLV